MSKNAFLKVQGKEISVIQYEGTDYLSLTNMTSGYKEGNNLISKWISNKNTLEYLSIWEGLNNVNFNYSEIGVIRNEAGVNRFAMSVGQWITRTQATGLVVKSGKYGGTYAHKDIAFHFAMWLAPEFQLLIVKEFQRLKDEENKLKNLEWDYRRFLSKVNYRIQTDSIKDNLLPTLHLPKDQEGYVYASEAEVVNVALFGTTSKQWKQANPEHVLNGLNIRDVADIHQLTVLSNLESINAAMIKGGQSSKERLSILRTLAIDQLKSLRNSNYTFPIESPHIDNTNHSGFDQSLKGLLAVPTPKNEKS